MKTVISLSATFIDVEEDIVRDKITGNAGIDDYIKDL
jgi:hypothetical protein